MVILYEMLQFKNTLYGVVVGNPTLNSFILLQKKYNKQINFKSDWGGKWH